MDEQKPGQMIAPEGDDSSDEKTETEAESTGSLEALSNQDSTVKTDSQTPWSFKSDGDGSLQSDYSGDSSSLNSQVNSRPKLISWSASEFIAHEKSVGWYLLLVAGGIVAAAIVYILTRDKISTAVIVIVVIAFGIVAARKPKELTYSLDGKGLTIGDKFYSYDLFKSFAIIEEGAFSSITLMPLKRFMVARALYYAPTDEKKIVDVLADRLPLDDHKDDPVDAFMRRIRF
jgi:hypothetical protein